MIFLNMSKNQWFKFYVSYLQNLKVIPLPREQYGKFYKGDSYIIYAASDPGNPPGVSDMVYICILVI